MFEGNPFAPHSDTLAHARAEGPTGGQTKPACHMLIGVGLVVQQLLRKPFRVLGSLLCV